MNVRKKMTEAEKLEFVKQIEFFYESTHAHLPKVMGFAFLKGVATGLGVFVGGTIVVALLLWILSGLSHVPFLNDITKTTQDTLESTGE
ncbi:MAG TPA: DUF5665 domain-containing protein [Candidatus Saccharimonadales bacterium]|nr:DUF5665 domain-containing protein [Candidatus Saccharimonadales bacterium]